MITYAEEAELLKLLLALVLAPPGPPWDRYDPGLQRAAAAAYLLLDQRPGNDAESFILSMLEPLVRDMSGTTKHHTVTDRQHLRGRVLWRATLAVRATQGDEQGPYVYRELHRQYDTPENQLLRLLVEQLDEALRLVPTPLRDGLCYKPAFDGSAVSNWLRLTRMEAVLRRVRANPRLRNVTLPQHIQTTHLLRAEASRGEGYSLAARLYQQYRQLIVPDTCYAALMKTGQRVLLLPHDADDQGKPWVALAALILRERVRA